MSSGRSSEALHRLEELKLVKRYRAGHDTFVFLTPAGLHVAARTAEAQVDSAVITGTPTSGNPVTVTFNERGDPVGRR